MERTHLNANKGRSRFVSCLAASLVVSLASVACADYYVSSGPLSLDGRIFRFADNGTPNGSIGQGILRTPIGIVFVDAETILATDLYEQTLRLFHADGTDLGVFASNVDPTSLLVDSYGNILMGEYHGNAIRRYSPGGIDLGLFALPGLTRQGQLAMDSSGNIYVSSFYPSERTIYRYDRDGNFLGVFSDEARSGILSPTGLAFRADGAMLVSETFHNEIKLLDSNGDPLGVFSASGMLEPEWLTVESNGDVLLPSWQLDAVRRYDSSGNDLGNFVMVPNPYQILRGPEVATPTAVFPFRKAVKSGNLASLIDLDGDVLTVERTAANGAIETPTQIDVVGMVDTLSPTAISVAVASTSPSSGTFTQEVIMVDKDGVPSPTVRRTDALSGSTGIVRLVATGDPANFVRPDGSVRIRIIVRQTSPASPVSYEYSLDRVVWTLR